MSRDPARADFGSRRPDQPGCPARRRTPSLVACALLLVPPAAVLAAEPPAVAEADRLEARPPAPIATPATRPAPRVEAMEMLQAILRGSRMEPGVGWFHPGESRYDWSWLSARFDRNRDGWVTAREFPGQPDAFRRLDRDENGLITPDDLDWSDPPPLFENADGPGLLRRALGGASDDEPPLGVLLKSWLRGDLGSFHEGPALGAMAPDFSLEAVEGHERLGLSQHRGKRPVVLVFGNMSCGPFRAHVPALEYLHDLYGDRVEFLLVYVREAHPVDGWRMASNDRVGIALPQPKARSERAAIATLCARALRVSMPVLADELDNRVGHAYSGLPARLYLIDRDGRVAYKSGRGPFGLKPGELEQAIVLMLAEEKLVAEQQRVGDFLRGLVVRWRRFVAARVKVTPLATVGVTTRLAPGS